MFCPDMKGVLEWLLAKVGSDENEAHTGPIAKKLSNHIPSVITPKTVPEFVIPQCSGSYKRSTQSTNSLDITSTRKAKSDSSAPSTSQLTVPADIPMTKSQSNLRKMGYSLRHVATSPGSLTEMVAVSYPQPCDYPYGEGGYMAAVSLPHLRTVTSYGFPTVSEHPNTRRKESLLLGSSSATEIKLMQRKKSPYNGSPISRDGSILWFPGSEPLSEVDEFNNSEEDLPCQTYFRRRSSCCSSSSDSTCEGGIYMRQLSVDKSYDTKSLAPLGELKYSVSYHELTRQCVVTVIKAENLMQGYKDGDCNSFVKVYLYTDQIKKDQTDIIRGTKYPVFNRSILFTDVVDPSATKLKLKVYNKVSSVVPMSCKRSVLGEVDHGCLDVSSSTGESIWRELSEPESTSGYLRLSMQFDPKNEELHTTIIEADKLRCTPSNSPKGIYVKVCISQQNRPPVCRKTRVVKGCVSWNFEESFTLPMSPKFSDLQTTSVDIKVMKKKLRGDNIIGMLTIGSEYLMAKRPETIFWNEVLCCSNTVITQSLALHSNIISQ